MEAEGIIAGFKAEATRNELYSQGHWWEGWQWRRELHMPRLGTRPQGPRTLPARRREEPRRQDPDLARPGRSPKGPRDTAPSQPLPCLPPTPTPPLPRTTTIPRGRTIRLRGDALLMGSAGVSLRLLQGQHHSGLLHPAGVQGRKGVGAGSHGVGVGGSLATARSPWQVTGSSWGWDGGTKGKIPPLSSDLYKALLFVDCF